MIERGSKIFTQIKDTNAVQVVKSLILDQEKMLRKSDLPMIEYAIVATALSGKQGFHSTEENPVLDLLKGKVVLKIFKKRSVDGWVASFAQEYAKDITELFPISKLDGINVCKAASKRFPDLTKISKDNSDEELQYSVEELLYPSQAVQDSISWRDSRIRIKAVARISQHLHQLGLPEIASYLLRQLEQHVKQVVNEER